MEPNVKISTNGFGPYVIRPTYKVFKFSGGEIQIRFDELDQYVKRDLKGAPLTLEVNITSSDILMEVLLLTDALRRMGHKTLRLKSKYFPYARQDRVCYPGESLSLKVVCDIINSQNYEYVTIWDAHSDVTPALLNNVVNVPVEQLIPLSIFLDKDYILVSPDAGATKKVTNVAKRFSRPMVTAEKIRDTNTGDILSTRVRIPWEHCGARNFLIVDDICDGGRTFIELAKVLRETTTGKIDLYVTHGIFSQGFEVFNGLIDHIYTANLLNVSYTNPPGFVTVVG